MSARAAEGGLRALEQADGIDGAQRLVRVGREDLICYCPCARNAHAP
ncbi:hypothetical protein M3J09_002830 [Ascochyta lentis]